MSELIGSGQKPVNIPSADEAFIEKMSTSSRKDMKDFVDGVFDGTQAGDETKVMVSVPLELLRRVLEQADDDNHRVEHEYACTAQDHAEHNEERAAIDQLRQIAGIAD